MITHEDIYRVENREEMRFGDFDSWIWKRGGRGEFMSCVWGGFDRLGLWVA